MNVIELYSIIIIIIIYSVLLSGIVQLLYWHCMFVYHIAAAGFIIQ